MLGSGQSPSLETNMFILGNNRLSQRASRGYLELEKSIGGDYEPQVRVEMDQAFSTSKEIFLKNANFYLIFLSKPCNSGS